MRNGKAVDPNMRLENVLNAAIELSRRDGYMRITRDDVAAHAGIGAGSVNRAFGTMNLLLAPKLTPSLEYSSLDKLVAS